jgi:uncharacterized membrane protein
VSPSRRSSELATTANTIARWALTIVMVVAGANHFITPDTYVGMTPPALPAPLALVYISGIAEIAGGLGLVLPSTRKLAAYGLIALYIAVFPANLNMAINHLPLGTTPVPTWALWARLPLQLVFIAWAWWVRKPSPSDDDRSAE